MKKYFSTLLFLTYALAAVWAISNDARLFEEAERRYQKGDYRFALSRYETLIRDHPDSEYIADAHFRKGLVLFRLGRTAEAVDYLERVKSRYAYTRFAAYIPFWLGSAYYQEKDYESALQQFSTFLSGEAARFREDALFYRGLCLRELDKPEEALESVREIAETPEELFSYPQSFRLFSDLLVKTNRYEELLSVYRKIDIQDAPEDIRPPLLLYRAEALHARGSEKEAENVYIRLLDAPTDISRIAYQRLFILYLEGDKEEDARRILEKAQSALSGAPELLNEFFLRVGIESYRNVEYELAESYLRRVHRSLSPESADPLLPIYLSHAVEKNDGPEEALGLLADYLAADASRYESNEAFLYAVVRQAANAERWETVERYGKMFMELHADSPRLGRVTYLSAFALRNMGQSRAALTVLSDLERSREEGDSYGDILRLTARLHMELEHWEEADAALREYLPFHRNEPEVYGNLVRVAFSRKNWRQVIDWAVELYDRVPSVREKYPGSYTEVRYLEGLAYLGMEEYGEGADTLEAITEEGSFDGSSGEIAPQLLFFLGWARYKRAEYDSAMSRFSELRRQFPEHPRVQESRFLSGWSAFAAEDYQEAEEAFAEYAKFADEQSERMRGLYMYARSLSARGRNREALSVYRQVFGEGSGTEAADDALFESADLQAEEGRIQDAVDTYWRLYRDYPRSFLAEEALYRRGRLLLNEKRYAEAREAFYEHRSRFPRGELVDLSLYWGAVSARKSGESYGAALLLERLVDEYSQSSFHADALKELAGLYDSLGDYEKAVHYYSRYRSLYPEEAEEFSVKRRIETLEGIMDGKSRREAELSATLEQRGLETEEGREAAVELAGIYLNRYTGNREEMKNRAQELLQSVVKREEEDSSNAARAQYHIGEYHRREGDFAEAAKAYARAAVISSGDDDLTARSMYMAAESAVKAGDSSGARRMLNRLQSEFPDSEWAAEGRRLIDEMQ